MHTRSLQVLAGNALRLLSSASVALAPAGALGLLLWLCGRGRRSDRADGTWLLVLAVLVPTLFFVLVYFHKKAYALVLLAPALVLAMRGLSALRPAWRTAVLATSLLLANAAYFALPADEALTVQASGQVTPSRELPAARRVLRHWLMPTHQSLRARDARIAATDAVIREQLRAQPTLVLVVPGTQSYDARTLMQRWPEVPIWMLPDDPNEAEVGYALAGRLQHVARARFADARRLAPSLWLAESSAVTQQPPADPGARTLTGPHHHLVLLPAIDTR